MDADHAASDRDRRFRTKISALWRPLPWWERAVYVLAVILFVLAFLLTELTDHLPDGWRGEMHWTLNLRLPEIDSLLLTACFPFLVATFALGLRRWRPDIWRDFRRLWSMRLVLVGLSVSLAFSTWQSVVELATPPDQIAPYLPSFLAVPAIAAGGLFLVGALLMVPEIIVRLSRAQRHQV